MSSSFKKKSSPCQLPLSKGLAYIGKLPNQTEGQLRKSLDTVKQIGEWLRSSGYEILALEGIDNSGMPLVCIKKPQQGQFLFDKTYQEWMELTDSDDLSQFEGFPLINYMGTDFKGCWVYWKTSPKQSPLTQP